MKLSKKIKFLIGSLAFGLSLVFFGVSSYAWHSDNKGNLISDNLQPINDKSSASIGGVTFSITDQKLLLNGTSTSGSWQNISTNSFTLSSGTYTIQWFTNYTGNNIGFGAYNNSSELSNLYQLNTNRYKTFTLTQDTTFTIVVWWQSSGIVLDNIYVQSMIYEGNYQNYTSFEPYGVTYYSSNNMSNLVQSSYGCFVFANSLSVYYNNGSSWVLYKNYTSCYEMALDNYIRFINGSLKVDDYTLIFTNLGGNSNWQYRIDVSFPISKVLIEYYNEWKIYGAISDITFTNYSSNSYTTNGAFNPQTIVLSEHNLLANTYLKSVSLTRYNPNIGIPYSQMGTPSMSNEYSVGYYDGEQDGYNNGFEEGFEDGKKEGIDIGYYYGYQEADSEDFTTNGFKVLIGSIFNYPINMIKSVFGFEFMGINVASIIMFILSIGIVAFVIKKFRG